MVDISKYVNINVSDLVSAAKAYAPKQSSATDTKTRNVSRINFEAQNLVVVADKNRNYKLISVADIKKATGAFSFIKNLFGGWGKVYRLGKILRGDGLSKVDAKALAKSSFEGELKNIHDVQKKLIDEYESTAERGVPRREIIPTQSTGVREGVLEATKKEDFPISTPPDPLQIPESLQGHTLRHFGEKTSDRMGEARLSDNDKPPARPVPPAPAPAPAAETKLQQIITAQREETEEASRRLEEIRNEVERPDISESEKQSLVSEFNQIVSRYQQAAAATSTLLAGLKAEASRLTGGIAKRREIRTVLPTGVREDVLDATVEIQLPRAAAKSPQVPTSVAPKPTSAKELQQIITAQQEETEGASRRLEEIQEKLKRTDISESDKQRLESELNQIASRNQQAAAETSTLLAALKAGLKAATQGVAAPLAVPSPAAKPAPAPAPAPAIRKAEDLPAPKPAPALAPAPAPVIRRAEDLLRKEATLISEIEGLRAKLKGRNTKGFGDRREVLVDEIKVANQRLETITGPKRQEFIGEIKTKNKEIDNIGREATEIYDIELKLNEKEAQLSLVQTELSSLKLSHEENMADITKTETAIFALEEAIEAFEGTHPDIESDIKQALSKKVKRNLEQKYKPIKEKKAELSELKTKMAELLAERESLKAEIRVLRYRAPELK